MIFQTVSAAAGTPKSSLPVRSVIKTSKTRSNPLRAAWEITSGHTAYHSVHQDASRFACFLPDSAKEASLPAEL